MKHFSDFRKALAEWEVNGCAMHFIADTVATWTVGTYEEIRKLSEESPRSQTIYALRAGGLSRAEITDRMADWDDGVHPVNITPSELDARLRKVEQELRETILRLDRIDDDRMERNERQTPNDE